MSDLHNALVQALQAQAAKSRGFLSEGMAHSLARVALETIRQHQRGGAAPAEQSEGEPGQETWEPTGEVRWLTEHASQPAKLQQAFRRLEDGQTVWRDVPLVVAQSGS